MDMLKQMTIEAPVHVLSTPLPLLPPPPPSMRSSMGNKNLIDFTRSVTVQVQGHSGKNVGEDG